MYCPVAQGTVNTFRGKKYVEWEAHPTLLHFSLGSWTLKSCLLGCCHLHCTPPTFGWIYPSFRVIPQVTFGVIIYTHSLTTWKSFSTSSVSLLFLWFGAVGRGDQVWIVASLYLSITLPVFVSYSFSSLHQHWAAPGSLWGMCVRCISTYGDK